LTVNLNIHPIHPHHLLLASLVLLLHPSPHLQLHLLPLSLAPFASPLAVSTPGSSSVLVVSSVTSSTSSVLSSTAPPSSHPLPSSVGLSASTRAITGVVTVVNTPISAPAVQDASRRK